MQGQRARRSRLTPTSVCRFGPIPTPPIMQSARDCAMPTLVKLSEEELEFLTKAADHTAGMRELLERYDIRMLVVTLGADGCLCLCRNGVFLRQHTNSGHRAGHHRAPETPSGEPSFPSCCSATAATEFPAPQVLQHILGVSCVAGSLTQPLLARFPPCRQPPRSTPVCFGCSSASPLLQRRAERLYT